MHGVDLAGRTLAGRYDVLELLGQGGMGAVYRAHDRELDELVALKVIRSDRANRASMVEQFRQEVKLARRVTHVNIARTYELGSADGVVFCTMELVDGESLRARLRRDRTLPVADAVAIARSLCDGLAVAHGAGVIHRDIKPDNVLLASDGRVVLADFGVAAITAEGDGALVGTVEYMAPEQARGEAATPAVDIYSVGLVLYEMLTGLRAFTGSMTELIVAKQEMQQVSFEHAALLMAVHVPPELAEVVEHATAREPERRIASARELARALSPWTPDEPVLRVAPPPRAAHPLATVVVLAPRTDGDDASRMHVAAGVHQELLRMLGTVPRVRVWPRVAAPAELPQATTVSLRAGHALAVDIRRGNETATLQLPLEIANVGLAADAIARAVIDVTMRMPDPHAESHELLLESRTLMQRGFAGMRESLVLLHKAHALSPGDPQISAELAAQLVRFGFVSEDPDSQIEARAMVKAALATAPHLAESHVANAYLELHTGDPAIAATEFRAAIACSPYLAEPHEGLGRMLLEAGFLGDAVARIEDALAIAPSLASVRWEIARAHALEGNWIVADEVIANLMREGDRPMARIRFALWRGDLEKFAEIRRGLRGPSVFQAELMSRIYDVIERDSWREHRESLLALARDSRSPSRRRLAYIAQTVAETAGFAGDTDACLAMLDLAVAYHLFDAHWFDRCPLLARARTTQHGARLHSIVKHRAHAILDALYCDRSEGSQTLVD